MMDWRGLGGTTDIAIVGGGLTALALARELHAAGRDVRLFEARSRLGGRILTESSDGIRVDLGPSWFWPGQPRVASLLQDLGLSSFDQYAIGDALLEETDGTVRRGRGWASMAGSRRVVGGMGAMVDALVRQLPQESIHLGAAVRSVGARRLLTLEDGRTWAASQIVVALPPRIAAGLAYDPPLPSGIPEGLATVPTWMAGHAKFVAVYERPFWRDHDLSGDAVSMRGPPAEIHDASAPSGAPAALFGFVGLPAGQRAGRASEVVAASLDQLARLFGQAGRRPVATHYADWSSEPRTAVALDAVPPAGHPAYGPIRRLAELRERGLFFASTETAHMHGGFLEGALGAAAAARAALSG